MASRSKTRTEKQNKTETDIQREIQLAASRFGCRLQRNNVGKTKIGDSWIVYGLGVGSSDLVGWTPGGIYLAVEVKDNDGRVSDEQQRYIDIVNAAGGIAFVARSAEEFMENLRCRLSISKT